MKPIIEPVDVALLKSELKSQFFLCNTHKAGNEVYIVNSKNSPNLMQEIGRLREMAFRAAGGGSGESIDIDHFDTMDNPYNQLIVWNPDANEIIGGYRFCEGSKVKLLVDGQPDMAIGHIFQVTEKFKNEYLPYTIELGRAFIQPKYQNAQGGIKSIFSLDNLWDGIGATLAQRPHIKYLIGKVTIFSQTDYSARVAMIYYLDKYFGSDTNELLIPRKKEVIPNDLFLKFEQFTENMDFKEGLKWLQAYVKERNESIPPLIHSYIELSPDPITFGTVFDPDFGDIYDTGMLITIDHVYQSKKERYIDLYKRLK